MGIRRGFDESVLLSPRESSLVVDARRGVSRLTARAS